MFVSLACTSSGHGWRAESEGVPPVVVVEVVEFLLDAGSVVVASLLLVQSHRFMPHCAGLVELAQRDIGVAHPVEGISGVIGVAELTEQGDGFFVVVAGTRRPPGG